MHQPNRHCNIGQNTSPGTNDAFLSFRSSIHFHILYFDLRKKEIQVTRMGVSNLGIARENNFSIDVFPLTSSVTLIIISGEDKRMRMELIAQLLVDN